MANETTENELNETGEPGTEYFMETLPGQGRYVAPIEETPLQDVDSVDESAPHRPPACGPTHGEPCAAIRCSSSPGC